MYLQRNSPQYPCGLSCIAFYDFYGLGGVAYVNGTTYSDDDYEDPEKEFHKQEILLCAIYILGGILAGLIVSIVYAYVKKVCRRRQRASNEVQEAQRPLLINVESF